MTDFRMHIHPSRQPVPVPGNVVDSLGRAVFGTFDKEFPRMDFMKIDHPCGKCYPNALNKLRLTLWEAVEIHLAEGVLLAAVVDMGVFGKTMHVFFDKRTGTVRSWSENLAPGKAAIAPTLLGGSVTSGSTRHTAVRFENAFEKGVAEVAGSADGKAGRLAYAFRLERVSLPSVVSMPFGKNKPVYSQKDLFRVKGFVSIDGRRLEADDETAAIIDDHRGYYPYRMHYDWATTMGMLDDAGVRRRFGLNLTANQSLDAAAYNENLIWLEGATSPLPPVRFEHDPTHAQWSIRDDHDMVNVVFKVVDRYLLRVTPLVIRIDYTIAFGSLSGYVRNLDGHPFVLDGMTGIGEDKTLRF